MFLRAVTRQQHIPRRARRDKPRVLQGRHYAIVHSPSCQASIRLPVGASAQAGTKQTALHRQEDALPTEEAVIPCHVAEGPQGAKGTYPGQSIEAIAGQGTKKRKGGEAREADPSEGDIRGIDAMVMNRRQAAESVASSQWPCEGQHQRHRQSVRVSLLPITQKVCLRQLYGQSGRMQVGHTAGLVGPPSSSAMPPMTGPPPCSLTGMADFLAHPRPDPADDDAVRRARLRSTLWLLCFWHPVPARRHAS